MLNPRRNVTLHYVLLMSLISPIQSKNDRQENIKETQNI